MMTPEDKKDIAELVATALDKRRSISEAQHTIDHMETIPKLEAEWAARDRFNRRKGRVLEKIVGTVAGGSFLALLGYIGYAVMQTWFRNGGPP